jgi:hypothetical protein
VEEKIFLIKVPTKMEQKEITKKDIDIAGRQAIEIENAFINGYNTACDDWEKYMQKLKPEIIKAVQEGIKKGLKELQKLILLS